MYILLKHKWNNFQHSPNVTSQPNLNKFKTIETISSPFSDHGTIKPEISSVRKMGKFTFLSKQCVKEENKREIRKYFEMKTQYTQNYEMQ